MATDERLIKLATATPQVLARVDAVLNGADIATRAPDQDCRLVTFTEAAKMMRISRPTVHMLVKAGRLDVVTLGAVNRIKLQSITDFFNGKRPPSTSTVERMRMKADRNRATAREAAQKRANGKRGAK